MAKSLNNSRNGERVRIVAIEGDTRFLSRITAIGLTIGCEVEMIENGKGRPLLLYGRDTMVAVNRKDSARVMVEEIP
jgi:ferrous iron transport protein A